ncbi:YjbF family lipoprotein [Salinicola halimionae]|uniref:YjbF family lipoprotein n=1 Tax=Salinicola halimionae TaxID=1949081 RepID=UPI001FD8EF15|nr:YjbF family lipoprotein [Salinicola halimionae]
MFGLTAASLALSGCSIGSGQSPLDVVPGFSGDDTSARAESISYASLDFHVAGFGGLVILASQAEDMTYWQFRDEATIALKDGYLHSSAGLEQNLIDTRITDRDGNDLDRLPWRQASSSVSYRITREWRTSEGYAHRGQADATLRCEASTSNTELPLTSRALQTCHETLDWDTGDVTQSTLWRAPGDGRLWAVETQPWPDAPTFDWKVARPW